ncbi:MAG: homocysteine S-methyltransferase family protein [Salibaculum sp.]|uniref:homocysteine S-methyltransferase family protein n=1 Tax=Roseovarius halophilus (ex Wu et al. 2025) TaxID=3376060 RepID=UPI00286FC034|nr:homocysteine S-methyltransferase family protein [Salibaculum sp.]MDR9427851.1 homocysteine S-methyltransferase family protein [Salibaculum sp.]MDR9483001.1 homocysteine S-methyltransferase family protein [Salibaculum sp.]
MRVTLLDGGIGQEMVKRAGDSPTPLWSTQAMMDHPGQLQAIHREYFDAGATIATANTYAVLRDRLAKAGIEDHFAALQSAALAEARAAAAGRGRVAGAIGPLVATYRPETHPPFAEAVPQYAEVARLMADRADLILCETVASLTHARAILDGALAAGKPVWVSFTVDDEDGSRLRSGERVAEAARAVADGGADAILANCAAPEAMPAALDAIAPTGLPCGAYGNAFTQITKDFLRDDPTADSLQARPDMDPASYADHALSWLDHGATILGGCCETGPAHIAEIARRLRAAGHRIA